MNASDAVLVAHQAVALVIEDEQLGVARGLADLLGLGDRDAHVVAAMDDEQRRLDGVRAA